jgi:dihydrofolate reductase
MGILKSFTFISLNGYYKGPDEDIGWHVHGEEEGKYSLESLQSGDILLFGRKTYEMMAAFWPSPAAHEAFPEVADGMNRAEKLVVSRSLKSLDWYNSRLLKENWMQQLSGLKQNAGRDITLLGSGSILTQLTEEKLIDEYQVMIDPVVIPSGTSLFNYLARQINLKLVHSRIFRSGVILLYFNPV